ncbi:LuxR C-terminal-related transcriptional regulator [Streptomyces sp. NPDC054940]
MRGPERARLREMVRGVAAGRGGSVRIEGEPGGGKTWLLDWALDRAREAGCRVWAGSAVGDGQPLEALLDCVSVSALTDRRADIVDRLRTGGPAAELVAAVAQDLREMCVRHSADAPLVLALDDAHRADAASLAVWRRLGTLARTSRLLLITTAGDPRGLPDADHVVRLNGLEPDTARQLLADVHGKPLPPELAARLPDAAGNPALLTELLGGEAEVAARVTRRLRFLRPETFDALRLAALLGEDFAAAELAALAGHSAGQLLAVLDEALAYRLIEESGERLRLRHPLVREALTASLPLSLRRTLHRQAAAALDRTGAPAERVLDQLHDLHDELDDWTLDWLARHGEQLLERAPAQAFELIQRAVERTGPDDRRRQILEEKLGAAAYLLRRPESVGLVRRLSDVATDPERKASLLLMLIEALLTRTEFTEAVETAQRARAHAGLPAPWPPRLDGVYALALWCAGDHAQAAGVVRALDAAGHDDPLTRAYTRHVAHLLAIRRHSHEEALDHIDRGLAALEALPQERDLRFRLIANKAVVLGKLDRIEPARASITEALELARATGNARRIAVAAGAAASLHYWAGRWDDALAVLDLIGDLAPDPSTPVQRHGLAALILGHRDRHDDAERHLSALDGLHIAAGTLRNHSTYVVLARALRAERRGDPAAALAELLPTLAPEYAKDLDQRFHWFPDIVRLALDTGDTDTARRTVDLAAAEAAQGSGHPGLGAAALRCRGLFAQDPGTLREALAYYETGARPEYLGRTLVDLAVAEAWHGDLEAARDHLNQAVDVYTTLGADWDVDRADARLRPLGVRRGRRGTHRKAATGWEALTPTELKVARRVAEGRSNPQIAAELFLSPRTVQTHVSHILGKLGVRSRTEVAREAARQQAP